MVSTECASAAVISSEWLKVDSTDYWELCLYPQSCILFQCNSIFNFFFFFLCISQSCFPLLSQNGRLGDADIERLKLTDTYINGTQVRDCTKLSTFKKNNVLLSMLKYLHVWCLCYSTGWWTLHMAL